jgi:N-acetylneuraminate lyase
MNKDSAEVGMPQSLRKAKTGGNCKLSGIMPALVSPHDGRERLAVRPLEKHIDWLYAAGVHGLYVCGATGEGYSMRLNQRKTAAQVAVECSRGRGAVIVHVGAQCTRDAAELAAHAAKAGADAIASIPPIGKSHTELLAYYREIARASGLPAIVYYIPVLTKYDASLQELLDLLAVPGVAGIKYTDWDMFKMYRILQAKPDAVVFHGMDEIFAFGAMYGASGGIGTWHNVVPKTFVAIWDAVQAGRLSEALKLQKEFLILADAAWRIGARQSIDLMIRSQGCVKHSFRHPFTPFSPQAEVEADLLLRPIYLALQSASQGGSAALGKLAANSTHGK